MSKFDELFYSIVSPNVKTFIKKRFKKHAVKTNKPGNIKTPEGYATYNAGDYLAFDSNGGQYPISAAEFEKLYEPTNEPEYWLSKLVEVKMFKTDKKMIIETPWGILTANPGDWVEIKDNGEYGAPRKQYCIDNDYILKENDN